MKEHACFLAQHGVYERGDMPPCSGRLIRCHLLPRQLILRSVPAEDSGMVIGDWRTWVPACGGPQGNGGHHGMLDTSRTIRLPYEALPPALVTYATELGLDWYLEREYRRS